MENGAFNQCVLIILQKHILVLDRKTGLLVVKYCFVLGSIYFFLITVNKFYCEAKFTKHLYTTL